jgi:hypothetical protein
MGGYPIGNGNPQYKTTYSLIVKEFLSYPKNTPEKKFCKAKWYVETSRLYGDLIHNEEYERAQIEALKKEQKRLQEEVKKANEKTVQLNSIINSNQLENNKENAEEDKEEKSDGRTMKVTTDVLMNILKLAGINNNNADKTQIANLIGYLTGYSNQTIRQRLTNSEELTSRHKSEVDKVNQILKKINSTISIRYNK